MKLLAPSILSADFTRLSEQIRSVEMGGADMIHCDIMDGHFVPNLTFGPSILKDLRNITSLPLDIHLMVEKPEKFINGFIETQPAYITVHQESSVHLHRLMQSIRENNIKAGVSINPSTPVELLQDILEYADLVLVMSVNPGFGGQKFIEASYRRIRTLAEIKYKNNYLYSIEVDGGISASNIKDISDSGCEIFVAGNVVFKSDNIAASTAELKNLISS